MAAQSSALPPVRGEYGEAGRGVVALQLSWLSCCIWTPSAAWRRHLPLRGRSCPRTGGA